MKAPTTRRIEGINRDSRSPQRIAYPIIRASREKAHPLAFAAVYGASALISISAVLFIYHLITK